MNPSGHTLTHGARRCGGRANAARRCGGRATHRGSSRTAWTAALARGQGSESPSCCGVADTAVDAAGTSGVSTNTAAEEKQQQGHHVGDKLAL